MSTDITRFLSSIILSLTITAATCSASAQNNTHVPVIRSSTSSLLDEKLEYYRHLYPEISFLNLKGGDELVTDMMILVKALGDEPSSSDYEHPEKLREELMTASVNRILYMLQFQMPSASLFKADKPPGQGVNLCVLTIHPQVAAADSLQATSHLLDLPDEIIERIPDNLQLSPGDYLAYVIDHEIYHCLHSMYAGPQKMSFKKYWGEYNHFLNEQGADAYAVGMHIKNRQKTSNFVINLQRIRAMALFSADPDHMTSKAIDQVINLPESKIKNMSANEVFDMAIRIKKGLTIGYDEYLKYLASAVQAMEELGLEEIIPEDLLNIAKESQSDPAQVKQYVENSRRCLLELRASGTDH